MVAEVGALEPEVSSSPPPVVIEVVEAEGLKKLREAAVVEVVLVTMVGSSKESEVVLVVAVLWDVERCMVTRRVLYRSEWKV